MRANYYFEYGYLFGVEDGMYGVLRGTQKNIHGFKQGWRPRAQFAAVVAYFHITVPNLGGIARMRTADRH